MPVEYTIVDFVVGGVVVAMALIGLFRGFSGELASFAGLAGAIFAGFFLYGTAAYLSSAFGCTGIVHQGVSGVINLAFAILAYGAVYYVVNKFVSLCIRQPTNAVLGLFVGFGKGVGIAIVLLWFNVIGVGDNGLVEVSSPVLRKLSVFVHQCSGDADK